METSSIRLEKEMEVEADRSARRKIETKGEMRKKDPVQLEEVCCREEKMERGKTQINFQKNCQGRTREPWKETAREWTRVPLRSGIIVAESRWGVSRRRITQKKREKEVETNASGKDGELKAQGRNVDEKKKKKKENRKRRRKKRYYKKRKSWKRCRRFTKKNLWMRRRRKDERKRRGWRKGRTGRWLFLIMMIGQNLGGADAASGNAQNRSCKFLNGKGIRWKAVGCRWMIKEIYQWHAESFENGKVNFTESFCVEYREEEDEKGTKGTSTPPLESSTEWGKKSWRSSSTKRPSKAGGLQLTQQGSPTRLQAVRIVSTRRERRVVVQSTAILEELLAKKKVRLRGFQETME